MNKKSIRYLTLSACMIGALFLTGCNQTKEKVNVTPKEETASGMGQEQSHEEENLEDIRKTLHAPKHVTEEVSDKTGNLEVKLDADIEIPEVNHISSYQVVEKEVDDAFAQKFADVFLGKVSIYGGETEDKGERETVIPQIGNADQYGNDYIAIKEDGSQFHYGIKKLNGIQMNISREITNTASSEYIWSEYQPSKDSGHLNVTPEEIQNKAFITYEEAKKMADKKVQALGLDYLRVSDWDYAYLNDGSKVTDSPDIKKVGYQFYYTRYLENIPITYTMATGGGYPEMDSDMETWCYEQMNILVTEDGIEKVDFACPYELTENQKEFYDLLPFNEILDIFQKMMLVENVDVLDYENWRTYTVDKISLGYSRIYDPKTDSKSGKLVPVWDFFGGIDCESEFEGKNVQHKNYNKTQSFMTINAMDGSVIDRELGY